MLPLDDTKYSREHESIPINPIGVLWVEAHAFVEEDMGNRSHAHRRTGMPGVAFGCSIDLEDDSELAIDQGMLWILKILQMFEKLSSWWGMFTARRRIVLIASVSSSVYPITADKMGSVLDEMFVTVEDGVRLLEGGERAKIVNRR